MKLYHLNANDYGQDYFVLAKSKKEAISYIFQSKEFRDLLMDRDHFWTDANENNLPGKYTLDEHNEGIVIRAEIA